MSYSIQNNQQRHKTNALRKPKIFDVPLKSKIEILLSDLCKICKFNNINLYY